MTQYGEISYDTDINFGKGNKSESTKDLWLRFSKGDNMIRLITNPFQYSVHPGIKKVGEAGYGRKIPCSKNNTESGGKCVLCDLGYKSQLRWYYGCIDLKTNTYKVIDVPYQVFSQIRKLNANKAVWGNPLNYDINVITDPNNKPNYYTVQPVPPRPLTAEQQKIRDRADLEYLRNKSTPYAFDVVEKILTKYCGDEGMGSLVKPAAPQGKTASSSGVKTAAQVANADVDDSGDDDSMDDIFPAYEPKAANS